MEKGESMEVGRKAKHRVIEIKVGSILGSLAWSLSPSVESKEKHFSLRYYPVSKSVSNFMSFSSCLSMFHGSPSPDFHLFSQTDLVEAANN